MDQQDNRDITHEWDDLLQNAFGSTENPIADIPESEPVKEEPPVITPVKETPAKRPLYRRFWFWLILIALIALLGIAAWFFFGKDTDTEPITPEDARMQEALDQCKAGLAQWQALESYYMTQSTLFYGSILGGTIRGEFWCSGDDLMWIRYQSDSYISGMIKHNGITYSAESYIPSSTGIPEKNYWSAPDENVWIASPALPWPMSFDWDTSEIVDISATGRASDRAGHSHFTSVSFSVLLSDPVNAYMYTCDVNFTFDVHSNLESVTVVHIYPGEAERTGISVITYRLGTTDYDIAPFIAEAPSQPLTSVISTLPVPLPG